MRSLQGARTDGVTVTVIVVAVVVAVVVFVALFLPLFVAVFVRSFPLLSNIFSSRLKILEEGRRCDVDFKNINME